MEAIVIFWILLFFSFLEAAIHKPDSLTSKEDMMMEKPTVWSKKNFKKCLESNRLDAAEELLKIDIEKSLGSVKEIIMNFIRTNNVDRFKFMIEKGPIRPNFDRGLFLNEACKKGQKSIVNYLLRSTNLLLPYADKCLFVASKKGHHQLVKLLLAVKGVDPAADDNYAIRKASGNGYAQVVKLLLAVDGVNPTADNNYAIRFASGNGYAQVVKLLLAVDGVDPTADNNYPIRFASRNGHAEVVKLLLAMNGIDPTADSNYAIRYASKNGHTEVVKLLLAVESVDPAAEDNYAIGLASENGHTEVVKLLL